MNNRDNFVKLLKTDKNLELRLADISLACAHVKQERHIMAAVNSAIWATNDQAAQWPVARLEVNKVDLQIGSLTVEAKYNYDFDVLHKIDVEKKHASSRNLNLLEEWQWKKENKKSYTWSVTLPVISDIHGKRPDVFVWIIHCRDLRKEASVGPCIPFEEFITFYEGSKRLSFDSWEDHVLSVKNRAMKFLLDDCDLKHNNITIIPKQIKNRCFPSDYLFFVCDLKSHIKFTPSELKS
jgi:hypothetical protein